VSPVVVIGAGVAGTAAAIAAAREGAHVVVVSGGTGASTLWTGRVDPHAAEVSRAGQALAEALEVKIGRSIVATTAASVRSGHGHEAALLDLRPLLEQEACVGVVRCDRPGWDAEAIARAAGDGFVVVPASVLRHTDERYLPDADFAERHDDTGRLAWLAERLREALRRAGDRPAALLLPPSLGAGRQRAPELSRLTGVACGEAMGLPGGPVGLRLEAARDRALAAAEVEVIAARANAVEQGAEGWRVVLDGERIEARSVVVAAGGLLGGGLEYQPSEWMHGPEVPPSPQPPFRCTLEGPLPLGARGRPLELPSSLFGVPPESIAWPLARDPLMDVVGLLASQHGRIAPGLYAAGEILADRPRTWLEAVESGVRAGTAAARDALTWAAAPQPSLAEAPASRP
jgi:glycine/D-amino acid oxidase-like deaminating enzyme